jgi:hypothetical protein
MVDSTMKRIRTVRCTHRRRLQPARNVVGMMPHPERAAEPALGCVDGLVILESIVKAFATA